MIPHVRLAGLVVLVLGLVGTHLAAYRHGTTTEHARMASQWQAGQLAAWQQAHHDAQAHIQASAAAATRAQRQRDQLSQRLAEIDHAPAPPPNPGCDRWSPDERLRLDARRAAHAAIDNPTPGLLHDPLPPDAPHPGAPL